MLSIKETQRMLKMLGIDPGECDGIKGENTNNAIKKFKNAFGLEDDGEIDETFSSKIKELIGAVQKLLNHHGYFCEVDGRLGEEGVETITALEIFQSDHNLIVDGIIGEKTYPPLFEGPLSTGKNSNASEHFMMSEYACDCDGYCNGFPVEMKKELLEKIERLRCELGEPIIITSGVRCKERNEEVGGVMYSKHLEGKAADLYCPGVHYSTVAKIARSFGLKVIEYQEEQFCHCEI